MRRSLPALAVASMLIAHGAALAQQPSTFIMLMNGDTLATESGTLAFRWIGDNGFEVTQEAKIAVE